MRIAVTGASGFIGTELLGVLCQTGEAEIIGLTRGAGAERSTGGVRNDPYAQPGGCSPAAACLMNGSGGNTAAGCEWKSTDYSVGSLTEALEGVDVVIHLAGVRGTTADPADYVINEEMTANLLAAMDAAGAHRIVFASTISAYDDVELIPWREDAPLQGRTMYGNSKIHCEELIRQHAGSHAENYAEHSPAGNQAAAALSAEGGSAADAEDVFTYAIVRIAQVLGRGERRRGMMNVFLDTARSGGELRVIGRSEAKRQYIYVKDLAEILTRLAVSTAGNVVLNAGMPHAYTNLEIAQIVNKVYDNKTPINYDDSAPETIRSSFMDITNLKRALSYEPLDMEAAVRALSEE